MPCRSIQIVGTSILCLVGAICAAQPSPTSHTRTWKDRTGTHAVEATLEEFADGTVKLKRADVTIQSVQFDRLSEHDQQFVREQTFANAAVHRTAQERKADKRNQTERLPSIAVFVPERMPINEPRLFLKLLLAANQPLVVQLKRETADLSDQPWLDVQLTRDIAANETKTADVLIQINTENRKVERRSTKFQDRTVRHADVSAEISCTVRCRSDQSGKTVIWAQRELRIEKSPVSPVYGQSEEERRLIDEYLRQNPTPDPSRYHVQVFSIRETTPADLLGEAIEEAIVGVVKDIRTIRGYAPMQQRMVIDRRTNLVRTPDPPKGPPIAELLETPRASGRTTFANGPTWYRVSDVRLEGDKVILEAELRNPLSSLRVGGVVEFAFDWDKRDPNTPVVGGKTHVQMNVNQRSVCFALGPAESSRALVQVPATYCDVDPSLSQAVVRKRLNLLRQQTRCTTAKVELLDFGPGESVYSKQNGKPWSEVMSTTKGLAPLN